MGAHLVNGGATFRVWAPNAASVQVRGSFNDFASEDSTELNKDEAGYWSGFIPGVRNRDLYKYWTPFNPSPRKAEGVSAITFAFSSGGQH